MGDEDDDSFGMRTYCIVCRQIIPSQRGPLYCGLDLNCNYTSHSTPGRLLKSCAKLPREISHPSHPQHSLSLLPRPPYDSRSFTCDSCKNTGRDFVFHCADCKFDLDVLCASLVPSDVGGDSETTFDSHLGLDGSTVHSWNIYSRHEKFEVLCSACRSPIESRICVCLECKVFMHNSCTLLPSKIIHPMHSLHSLSLFKWKSFYPSNDGSKEQPCEGCWGGRGRCIVCGDGLEGNYAYQCLDCKIKIDIKCSFLTPKTYDFHQQHPLVLVNTNSFNCSYCKCKDCSPMLRSVDHCDYNVHLHCVPSLPQTVVHKHVHPLKLVDYPIKDYDDEDDDVELYCDACEELRSLNDPTYFCDECHYVCHVRCAISDEALLALGKDLPSVSELHIDDSEGNSIDMANRVGAELIRTKGEIMLERLTRNCKDLDHQIESVESRLQELKSKLEVLNLEQARAIQSPNVC